MDKNPKARMRLAIAIAALAAALSLVAAAGAAVLTSTTPPYPPTTHFKDYYQVLDPYHCNGGQISASGLPVLIKFGWFSKNVQEERSYFQHEYGSVTIAGPDTYYDSFHQTAGSPPPSDQNQGGGWSPIFASTVTNNGTTVSGVASFYLAVLSAPLTTGSYTLTWTFTLDRSISDGFYPAWKGTYTSSCTFTVS